MTDTVVITISESMLTTVIIDGVDVTRFVDTLDIIVDPGNVRLGTAFVDGNAYPVTIKRDTPGMVLVAETPRVAVTP